MKPRRVLAILVVALIVLAAAGVTAWRAGWPPAIFGSPSALVQTHVDQVSAIGAESGAAWYPVAKEAYVNDLSAWKKLPPSLRSSSLAQLRSAERRFRALGIRAVPQRPLFTVRQGPSPDAARGSVAFGVGGHATLLAARSGKALGQEARSGDALGQAPSSSNAAGQAARSGKASGDLSTDFGATGLGASALSFGSPGLWAWTPCVSVTPPGGHRAVKICGGKVIGSSGDLPLAGLTGSAVATIGEAAGQAYIPATAVYTNQTGRAQKLTISGSVASVTMVLDQISIAAAGCTWSKLRYDTPASGTDAPPLPNPPLIDTGTCQSTFSLHVPLPEAYATKVDAGMATARNIYNSASDAYSTVTDKSELTSAPALEACATGQILSDLSTFLTDFGGIGVPGCQPTPLPTWTGTLAPGKTLDFSFTPTTWVVDGGAGVEITGLFSFVHIHVAATAAQGAPELYIHNGIVLGSLFKQPNFPATIGLDNHDYLSDLQWSQASPGGVTAKGTLNVDNCTPDCASGSNVTYPAELIAFAPKRCPVAVYKQSSSVPKQENAYVFNKIQLKALSGNPPSSLVGFPAALSPACGSPVVVTAPCTQTALTGALNALNVQPGGWTVVRYACQGGYSFVSVNPSSGGMQDVAVLQQQGSSWKVIYGPNEGLCLTAQNQSYCQGFKLPLPRSVLNSLMRQAGYGQ